MKILPPVASAETAEAGTATAAWHGGNDYRGPGAWTRSQGKSKKRPRTTAAAAAAAAAAADGPLDLAAVLGEGWRLDLLGKPRHRDKARLRVARSKRGKAAALQARLASLSLRLAPPHGEVAADPLANKSRTPRRASFRRTATAGSRDPGGTLLPLGPNCYVELQSYSRDQPGGGDIDAFGEAPECAILGSDDSSLTKEIMLDDPPRAVANARRQDSTPSALPPPTQINQSSPRQPQEPEVASSALRIPNVVTKMSVDDRCSAELLGARATLRLLLREQRRLGEAMRQRRIAACLGKGGEAGTRRRGKSTVPLGRRERRRHGGRGRLGEAPGLRRRLPSNAHPLLFMAEADLQKVELERMRLEDAEAKYTSMLEGARRRKIDYATYYALALRYGPLAEALFESMDHPGSIYETKVFDAARVVQTWWWGVWPPLLRRRKAASLVIQKIFRGFLQRRKWRTIIRIRTLWGNTRVVAHSFMRWRGTVSKTMRARAFAQRCQDRCKARCFAVLADHTQTRRRSKEDVVGACLRRASHGIRLRVFEAWVRYTQTSLAVERMRLRRLVLPVMRAWRTRASMDRRHGRLRWACALIASRLLRWRRRIQYLDVRRACIKVQRAVRSNIVRARIKKDLRESRVRRAEETVQALEDERVRRLLDVEQQRRDSLQAAVEKDTPLVQKKSSAFLQTAAGKASVTRTLANIKQDQGGGPLAALPGHDASLHMGGGKSAAVAASAIFEAEATQDVIRRFVWQEQASRRHDFNAEKPPPLSCPRPDCDATFVDRIHCVRHAVDVHPTESPGIWKLASTLSDPGGLDVFEEYAGGGTVSPNLPQTVRETLSHFKKIQEWRTVPSSSDHYQQLTAAILAKSQASTDDGDTRQHTRRPVTPGETLGRGLEKLGATHQKSAMSWMGSSRGVERQRNSEPAGDAQAIEDASWQALVHLHEEVGVKFLGGLTYATYLHDMDRPRREAVAAAAADLADRERAEWVAEARALRLEVFHREQDGLADTLAEEALEGVLVGDMSTTAGLLGGLVDDQATLLALVIIAERRALAKVLSAVWNEAVDEAAYLTALELREVDPTIANALSEATCSFARSQVADDLITQTVLDLTGPDGELWPDARAMAAVADGVAYRVRAEVMDELLEASVLELQEESGQAARLTSDYAGGGVTRTGGAGVISTGGRMGDDTAARSSVLAVAEPQQRNAADENTTSDARSDSSTAGVIAGEATTAMAVASPAEDEDVGEAMVKAAVVLQSFLRQRAAWRDTKVKVARTFTKLYDPESGHHYWYNQATGESTWDKPRIIDNLFKKKTTTKTLQ